MLHIDGKLTTSFQLRITKVIDYVKAHPGQHVCWVTMAYKMRVSCKLNHRPWNLLATGNDRCVKGAGETTGWSFRKLDFPPHQLTFITFWLWHIQPVQLTAVSMILRYLVKFCINLFLSHSSTLRVWISSREKVCAVEYPTHVNWTVSKTSPAPEFNTAISCQVDYTACKPMFGNVW